MHDPKMVEMVVRAIDRVLANMHGGCFKPEGRVQRGDCADGDCYCCRVQRHCATATLDALAAAGRLVPKGAVVVPRIATWEMIEAARDAGSDEESWGGIYDAFVSRSPYMPPAAPRPEDQT